MPSQEFEEYESLRCACSEAHAVISIDKLSVELGMAAQQPDAEAAFNVLFAMIEATLKTVEKCENSALRFHCGAAAFGQFVELGILICEWFCFGILSPPLAKSLFIQLEDLYRRVAIQVSKLKLSLQRVGCDPSPFGDLLDTLTQNESHFPVRGLYRFLL
jgi:hypothetical protein